MKKERQYIYEYACEIYHGMERYSGDEYITHPLHTVLFCWADMGDGNTIREAVCDVMQKKGLWTEKNLRNTWQREVGNWL